MQQPFKTTYDERGDVLYITGADNREATGWEIVPGVVLRFAHDNGALVGITIVGASEIRRDAGAALILEH